MPDTIDWLKIENRLRATPLDLLRQGVSQRSWQAIDAAFTMLTGCAVENKIIKFPESNTNVTVCDPPVKLINTPIAIPAKRKRGRPKKQILINLGHPSGIPPQLIDDATDDTKEIFINTIKPSDISNVATATVPNTYGLPSECVATSKAPGKKTERIKGGFIPHDMKPHVNTWVDTRVEASNEIIPVSERKLPQEVLESGRPPIQDVDIRCSVCGRHFKVDPSLVPNEYRAGHTYGMQWKCNDCCVGFRSGVDVDLMPDDEELLEDESE